MTYEENRAEYRKRQAIFDKWSVIFDIPKEWLITMWEDFSTLAEMYQFLVYQFEKPGYDYSLDI